MASPIPVARAERRRRSFEGWIVPGLLALGAIPAVAGAVRLASFAHIGAPLSDGERFASHPAALATHIVSALLYTLLGAFQFAPGLRRKRPFFHRMSGWIVAPAGLVLATSGLWTMVAYPPAEWAGSTVHAGRVVTAVAMFAFVLAGLWALTGRDVHAHRARMTRAYAIGIAGGTQALVILPLTFLVKLDESASFTAGMVIGWLVNVTVGEWIIRRREVAGKRTA